MYKYVVLLSVFGLTGCAALNPGVCDRAMVNRYPECSDPEISENFNETSLISRNDFRLNIYNSSWDTTRIYIHCYDSDRRLATMSNPIFTHNTRQIVNVGGCRSIYLITSGYGQTRRSDQRSVVPREDICAEVTQTMDIRWGVCPVNS